MDGRIQLPVIEYLQKRFKAEYVDSITEPGPVRFFVAPGCQDTLQSIISRVDISVNHHGSQSIAVCAHADCAGNPVDDETQQRQLDEAVNYMKKQFPGTEVVGLWLDPQWEVHEMY
jgi:hypothetical protein